MFDVFRFWLLSLIQFGVYTIGPYTLLLFPTFGAFTYDVSIVYVCIYIYIYIHIVLFAFSGLGYLD